MFKKFIASVALVITGLQGTALAQDNESDFQAWTALAVSGPVEKDSRFLLWFDGHARFRDDASELGVSIIRPGIGWRINDNLDAWLGYARVVSRSDTAPNVEENRIWQQATYSLPQIFGGNFSGRTRLEQRFRDTGDDTGWRVRQFIRWERPFVGSEFSIVAWDEVFVGVNDTDWGQRSGFDQNRLFLGGAWRFSNRARLEVGYLNNALNLPGTDDQTNHNISAALFVGL